MFKKNSFKVGMILAVLALALVFALNVNDTLALFSDSGSSTENVFTAGTVDMKMANNGIGYHDNTSATWVSPDGWLPSDDPFAARLSFTNVGSADINEMLMDFNIVSRTDPGGDGSHLEDVIIISEWKECFNGVCDTFEVGQYSIDNWCGDNNGTLYLSELVNCSDFAGKSGVPGPVTQDSVAGTDGILLAAGHQRDYSLRLVFDFEDTAGNEYQGDSIEMEANFVGTPTKIIFP